MEVAVTDVKVVVEAAVKVAVQVVVKRWSGEDGNGAPFLCR